MERCYFEVEIICIPFYLINYKSNLAYQEVVFITLWDIIKLNLYLEVIP